MRHLRAYHHACRSQRTRIHICRVSEKKTHGQDVRSPSLLGPGMHMYRNPLLSASSQIPSLFFPSSGAPPLPSASGLHPSTLTFSLPFALRRAAPPAPSSKHWATLQHKRTSSPDKEEAGCQVTSQGRQNQTNTRRQTKNTRHHIYHAGWRPPPTASRAHRCPRQQPALAVTCSTDPTTANSS